MNSFIVQCLKAIKLNSELFSESSPPSKPGGGADVQQKSDAVLMGTLALSKGANSKGAC